MSFELLGSIMLLICHSTDAEPASSDALVTLWHFVGSSLGSSLNLWIPPFIPDMYGTKIWDLSDVMGMVWLEPLGNLYRMCIILCWSLRIHRFPLWELHVLLI